MKELVYKEKIKDVYYISLKDNFNIEGRVAMNEIVHLGDIFYVDGEYKQLRGIEAFAVLENIGDTVGFLLKRNGESILYEIILKHIDKLYDDKTV